MSQFLKNEWSGILNFYKESAEWDEGAKQIVEFAKSISVERNITMEDSLFIILYGNARVNDKEVLRRLN